MRFPTTLLLCAALLGCGNDGGSGSTPATDVYSGIDDETAAVESGLLAHDLDMKAADDLGQMRTFEGVYRDRMMGHLGTLDTMCGMLDRCFGEMRMDDAMLDHLNAATGRVGELRAEAEAHFDAMSRATAVTAGRSEEVRHQGVMRDLLSGLRGHRRELERDAGRTWSCDEWDDSDGSGSRNSGCPGCW
jgi:hypothetical protein